MQFYLTLPSGQRTLFLSNDKNQDVSFKILMLHLCPEKEHLGALIASCNQPQVFFLTEQTSHFQASDETTGFLIWH